MSDSGRQPDAPVITRWIGRLRGAGSPFRTPEQFVLAGIDWQGPEQALIELRARGVTGGWTPWVRASVLGHDSDRGETIAHALVGEPIWTGRADAVQLRSNVAVEGLNLHLVRAATVLAPGQPGVGAAATDPAQTGPSTATAAQSLPLAIPRLPAGPGQPPIIARQAWAGGLLPRVPPAYGDVRMAFVHHSVTANGYSRGEVPAMLRSIYYFHTYTRGWNDFGYNFAVDRYGRIWEGRAGGVDRPVIGAQAGGYNLESFGAVLLGDFVATLPTSAALAALGRLVAWKLALHGVPVTGTVTVEVNPSDAYYTRYRPGQHVSLPRIAAHRDGCTTDCPGYDMYVNGMPPLRTFVSEIVGRQLELTLEVGRARGAYAIDPYAIAPGTKVKRASYLDIATVILTAGHELPLHGVLRSLSGAPVRAAKIRLQSLTSSRREVSEANLATAVTRAGGLWAAALKPQANLLVRALHADAPAAVSALIAVGVKPEITLALTRTDGGVAVSGTVSPAKPRIVLKIQSVTGAQRVVEHRTVEPKHGAFETMIRLSGGRYWVTAQTVADATNLAGSSRRVAVHI